MRTFSIRDTSSKREVVMARDFDPVSRYFNREGNTKPCTRVPIIRSLRSLRDLQSAYERI